MKILGKAYQAVERQLWRFRSLFIFLALAAIGSAMLFMSWRRWPDILVDFGKELYNPWQINAGRVLYKDIAFLYGPLSPYLNALIFRVFGTHLMVIVVFNIILICLLVFILYRIFLAATDWITAAAVSTTFLAIFAFSQYVGIGNYNFVCPYTHGVTHGIFLSFLSIYLFWVYLTKRKNAVLFFIGILLGAVFLAKVEIFLAISFAIFFGVIFVIINDKFTASGASKAVGLLCLGFLIPEALFVLGLSRRLPFAEAFAYSYFPYEAVIKSSFASSVFFRRAMGFDLPLRNALSLISVGGWYLAAVFVFGLIGYGIKRILRNHFAIGSVIILCGSFFFLQLCSAVANGWLRMFAPLPLAMLILGAVLFIALLRNRRPRESSRLLLLFVMAVFSFLLLMKILLNARIYHLGFALAMPATLLMVALLVHYLPVLLSRIFGESNFLRFYCLLFLGVILVVHINISRNMYSLKSYPIGSGLDTIYDFSPQVSARGTCIDRALKEIQRIIKKDETFLVFPEGVMLNYLSRRANPTPYYNFIPEEVKIFGEGAMLDAFIKDAPDYIILVDRDMAEFGCYSVGQDCARDIFRWISENYSPVSEIGSVPFTGKGFGIVISKRVLKVP